METSSESSSESSVVLTPEEIKRQKDSYRFGGYTLTTTQSGAPHLITLDETGASYLVVPPHPEYTHPQPNIWIEKATSLFVVGRIQKRD